MCSISDVKYLHKLVHKCQTLHKLRSLRMFKRLSPSLLTQKLTATANELNELCTNGLMKPSEPSRISSESLGHVGNSHQFCSVSSISPRLVPNGLRIRHQLSNGGDQFVFRWTRERSYGETLLGVQQCSMLWRFV